VKVLPKLNNRMENQLTNSLIDAIGIISEGNIYSVRTEIFDFGLISSINSEISDFNIESVLMDVKGRLIYANKLDELIIVIIAKRAASLSFLRSICQNVIRSIDIKTIKQQIAEEGCPIAENSLKHLLERTNTLKGDIILSSLIGFVHPAEFLPRTKGVTGYIFIHSEEGNGLIVFDDGEVKISVFEGEGNKLEGNDAINRIYALDEGEIECYKIDDGSDDESVKSSESNPENLSLIGLDDGAMEVICEAKRLRDELSNLRLEDEN